MTFNKDRFYKNAIERIESLSKHVYYLGDLQYAVDAYGGEPSMDFDEDEFIANSVIKDSVLELKLAIISATEQLGLTSIRESFLKEFEQYNDKENVIELLPWFDTAFSPVLTLIRKYVTAIAIDVEQESKTESSIHQPEKSIDSIRRLLKNSGFLLNYMKITPKSEHEIHKPIFAQLKTLYPSAINKYKIHKPNKDYEIDIMVTEEKVGIELKFAKSEQDVKNQVDELYTDMTGYEENDSVQKYIAVLYMDSQYITEDVVQETLKQNNCPVNWEIILVINSIAK
jgi:hypothetical protein